MKIAAAAAAVAAGGALLIATTAAAPAGAVDMSQAVPTCLACHGAHGQSQTADVPSLGAQQPNYTITQLFLFREGMRVAAPMNDLAKPLADDDLRAIAAALEKLPAPKPPATPGDPARLERASQLVAQNHCNVCHRKDFSGQQSVPRLAGQREDYLLKSLRAYKSGQRRGYEPTMAEAVQSLNDAQLADLAYYIAHFH
jgi:cytochrome c553